jgi:hypothetical protein
MINSTWKCEVIECAATAFQPGEDACPGWLQKFKLDRSASFLLDNHCARPDPAATDEIADLHLDDVTSS